MYIRTSLEPIVFFQLKTDPLHNPGAPAGPFFIGEYRSAKTEEAARLNEQATETFEMGNLARKHADDYVQVTVALATVLLFDRAQLAFQVAPRKGRTGYDGGVASVPPPLPYPHAAASLGKFHRASKTSTLRPSTRTRCPSIGT